MTDEAAVLLRISLFGLAVAVLYWFISYEPLGTMGFLVLGAASGVAGLYLALHQRPKRAEPLRDQLRRLAGVPARDVDSRVELDGEDLGVLPHGSIWPFVLALGATTAVTGFALGLWPIVLGGGIAAVAIVGWQLAVNREQRYGRLRRQEPDAGRDLGTEDRDAR